MNRRQNFQNIAWFWDVYQRGLLNLEPPYQRRSVWNREYKEYFIDTILLDYPAPALFLYEEINDSGTAKYNVVDGKQRLTSIFEFINGEFSVGENAEITELRSKYFLDLGTIFKSKFWGYQFSVEYLPNADESIINNIFNRINKNVVKLTPQELRHAKYDGEFIHAAETLSEWMFDVLPSGFPRLASKSKMQMKDVELVANLLLLLEDGPKGYSQNDLDKEFSAREEIWDKKHEVEKQFRETITIIQSFLESEQGASLYKCRLQNQADFYSLFGAISSLITDQALKDADGTTQKLLRFMEIVENAETRSQEEDANLYFEAARSASNDSGPRTARIQILCKILK